MGLHRRPEIAGFLAKAYETLQFKANKTASSAHKINALRVVQAGLIIVTGLTLAFGDTGGGFRRLIQIVFGISIAFAASSFFLSFFSFGGGALV
ncbi:TrbC/VirB2 family protein [Paracoccus yeei]|uniref:TrbC/VirB2 family protein n=1 Tax=Paracoccus yeei TaxID=147645 RepID=UPI00267086E5|nr:TrbC/VirB2 family protein [Paracoccus yeei]